MQPAVNDEGTIAGNETSAIEQLKEQIHREHEMYVRALADFDNYRRRIERERDNAAFSERRELILSFIDLLDTFELALRHIGDVSSSTSEGLMAIYRKLRSLLERQGITAIETLGEPFDPRLHEAIGSVSSDEYKSGTVAEEVQRGYRRGDDLLRPARVRVAS